MRSVLALAAVCTAFGLAAHAHADTDAQPASAVDNANFLSGLHAAGITYNDADQAIGSARTMCELLGRGETGLAALQDLKVNNPGFTTDGAVKFAALAAHFYCPQQLAANGSGNAK